MITLKDLYNSWIALNSQCSYSPNGPENSFESLLKSGPKLGTYTAVGQTIFLGLFSSVGPTAFFPLTFIC